ncbi:hypothetical protein N8639_00830 [bacterium]|nr:hypothetical protein [bacterium]
MSDIVASDGQNDNYAALVYLANRPVNSHNPIAIAEVTPLLTEQLGSH